MAGQLEQPHDPDNREELQDIVLFLQLGEQEIQVETQRCNYVDDVHGSLDEVELVVSYYEPDNDLESKPRVTSTFEVEECHIGLGSLFDQLPEKSLNRGDRKVGLLRIICLKTYL